MIINITVIHKVDASFNEFELPNIIQSTKLTHWIVKTIINICQTNIIIIIIIKYFC